VSGRAGGVIAGHEKKGRVRPKRGDKRVKALAWQSGPLWSLTTGYRVLGTEKSCDCEGIDDGEFDPGSERTLAAWIRHASRTTRPLRG
jgi:hypothetical protein